jgi:hypothetical protein
MGWLYPGNRHRMIFIPEHPRVHQGDAAGWPKTRLLSPGHRPTYPRPSAARYAAASQPKVGRLHHTFHHTPWLSGAVTVSY